MVFALAMGVPRLFGVAAWFAAGLTCCGVIGCGTDGGSSHVTGAAGSGGSDGSMGGATSSGGSSASGGSTAAAACDAFIPCGGDVTGTWHVARTCIATQTADGAATTYAACADQFTSGVADENVTMTFSGGGTLAIATTPGISQSTRTFTQECLSSTTGDTITAEDMPARCANLNVDEDTPTGHLVMSCSMSAANCVCDVTFTVTSDSSTSVTYSTSGNTLTIGGVDNDYCVEGNTLAFGSAEQGTYDAYTR